MNTQCENPNCSLFGEYDCPVHSVAVSDPDVRLDRMVQQASKPASTPSLAELYKRAKAKGLTLARSAYQ